ncbi:MAG TPA: DUF559 domain-containing protein [Acidimicrobiia bacterium]|nr:DUF559 domain-containing protein [Acidimicrobiia bacterium]
MDYDKIIRDLGADQHGLLARWQLNAAGVHYRAINRRVESGMLEWASERVLRIAGAPLLPEQRLLIPVLHAGPDTFVSHETTVAWWGIAGFRLDRVHIAMERCYRRRIEIPHVKVHHSTAIPDWCRKIYKGVPVVAPALAIYQLAATASRERLARALDNGWSLGLYDGRTIDRLLHRLGRSGRNGTVAMRELRQQRGDDWTPPASNLESRFNEVAEANGFRFRRQVNIGDDEEWTGRVDFLAEDCPLIVEILSERYHTSLTDREVDEARRHRHSEMGYMVVEVWDHEIFSTPWLVIERIRRARVALLRRSPRPNRPPRGRFG